MRYLLPLPALFICLAPCEKAFGQETRLQTSISTSATLSDNVRLAPKGQEESDLYFSVTPSLSLFRDTSRLKLSFNYSPSLNAYPFSETTSNVTNNLSSSASARLIDDFLFLDATASIAQTFVSPFAPRTQFSNDLSQNQTTLMTFGVSPYIKGRLPGDFTYLVKDESNYTTGGADSIANLYENHAYATLESPQSARVRAGLDLDYRYTKFQNAPYYAQSLVRFRPGIQVLPNLVVRGRAGYDSNNYATDSGGFVYGGGIDYAPTPRTNLSAFAEKRFFGTGYGLDLSHRTRLLYFTVSASQDIATYRDQGLQLQPGFTPELLFQALASRIPDPFERFQRVVSIINDTGLPLFLTQPFSFVANQPYINNRASASFALIGKRSSGNFYLSYQNSKPVPGVGATAALPDVFVGSNRLKQWGTGITLNHIISTGLTGTFDVLRNHANGADLSGQFGTIKSVTDTVRFALTQKLSPKTDASAGIRWVNFKSDVSDYVEHAVFVSLSHRF